MIAVAWGGAIGAVLRWALGELLGDGGGFPWTTFVTNVAGCFLLGCLPAVAAVRRRPWATDLLGPGVLGGFTTMSAYAEQARSLLDSGRTGLAAAYLVGTLVACAAAVLLARRLTASGSAP